MQLKFFTALASVFAFTSVYVSATSLAGRQGPLRGSISTCVTAGCGDCTAQSFISTECTEIPGGTQETVSCVEVPEGWTCTVFQNANCIIGPPGATDEITAGNSSLPWGNTGFDSFSCSPSS